MTIHAATQPERDPRAAARGRALLVAGAACLLLGCPKEKTAAPDPADERSEPADARDAGTANETAANGGEVAEDAARDAGIAEDRPQKKQTVLYLEGNPEAREFTLYETPGGFAVPFSTYVEEGLVAESGSDEVRFVANFADVRNDDAFASVRALPEGVSADEAKAAARAAAKEYGLAERRDDAPDRYRWSLAEFDIAGSRGMGTVAVAGHAGRYVLLVVHYPEEYSEGFAPRAARLFEEWRWEDGGAWLTAEIPDGKESADGARARSKSFRIVSPSHGQGIRSPVRVEGSARVYEGAFQIELEDGHDVVAEKLMQVEGAPAWGSFSVDLEYDRPSSPAGTLILLFQSARDGSRVEELRIPVAFLDTPVADAPDAASPP